MEHTAISYSTAQRDLVALDRTSNYKHKSKQNVKRITYQMLDLLQYKHEYRSPSNLWQHAITWNFVTEEMSCQKCHYL